jgi:hypothetical protein
VKILKLEYDATIFALLYEYVMTGELYLFYGLFKLKMEVSEAANKLIHTCLIHYLTAKYKHRMMHEVCG